MFDLILKNGTLVNEGKIFESDIAIKGNRIEKIAASIDSESKNVVDLNGKYVIPGLIDDQVNTSVGNLSGGQKARLALILLTVKAPHLMILDEPTNHLDIESRERLAASLNNFEGGVIIISHDAHIINLIATELWLVKDNSSS